LALSWQRIMTCVAAGRAPSAFQVHRLADDALEGVTGLVEYHDHFNRF
jgi:predicted N-acetyltransferase YhbS